MPPGVECIPYEEAEKELRFSLRGPATHDDRLNLCQPFILKNTYIWKITFESTAGKNQHFLVFTTPIHYRRLPMDVEWRSSCTVSHSLYTYSYFTVANSLAQLPETLFTPSLNRRCSSELPVTPPPYGNVVRLRGWEYQDGISLA